MHPPSYVRVPLPPSLSPCSTTEYFSVFFFYHDGPQKLIIIFIHENMLHKYNNELGPPRIKYPIIEGVLFLKGLMVMHG